MELYATAFKAGAKKSKTAIMQTLRPLDFVPEHLWEGLGRQGRAFRQFVGHAFQVEEEDDDGDDEGDRMIVRELPDMSAKFRFFDPLPVHIWI